MRDKEVMDIIEQIEKTCPVSNCKLSVYQCGRFKALFNEILENGKGNNKSLLTSSKNNDEPRNPWRY